MKDPSAGEEMGLTKLSIKEPIHRVKPPADPRELIHRDLLDGPFWQRIPAYRDVSEQDFLDHKWQARNSITSETH